MWKYRLDELSWQKHWFTRYNMSFCHVFFDCSSIVTVISSESSSHSLRIMLLNWFVNSSLYRIYWLLFFLSVLNVFVFLLQISSIKCYLKPNTKLHPNCTRTYDHIKSTSPNDCVARQKLPLYRCVVVWSKTKTVGRFSLLKSYQHEEFVNHHFSSQVGHGLVFSC